MFVGKDWSAFHKSEAVLAASGRANDPKFLLTGEGCNCRWQESAITKAVNQVAKIFGELNFELGGKGFHLVTLERHFAHTFVVLRKEDFLDDC